MSVLKEINCAGCGIQTNLLFRTKLRDGKYVCSKCMKIFPSYMKQTAKKEYTLEEYNNFKGYLEYSEQYLQPIYRETHSFHQIGMDTNNLIFRLGYSIDKNTLFLKFENLVEFDMVFKPEEYKKDLVGNKVKGDIVMGITMSNPCFKHEEILVYGAKAKARKALFGASIRYENPKGMDLFMDAFACAWEESMSKENESYYSYNEAPVSSNPSELQQAMVLFMIDNLDDITLSSLKLHRNRLMQTFHPDAGSSEDTKYAQKINTAYDVLKNALTEVQ